MNNVAAQAKNLQPKIRIILTAYLCTFEVMTTKNKQKCLKHLEHDIKNEHTSHTCIIHTYTHAYTKNPHQTPTKKCNNSWSNTSSSTYGHSAYSDSGLGVAPWRLPLQILIFFRNPNVGPSSYPYTSTEWFSDMPTNFGLPPVHCSQWHKENGYLGRPKWSR